MGEGTSEPGRAALFLDRDGTLTHDEGYTFCVEGLKWLPGAQEAIAAANAKGVLVVLITNQSGIGRGYFTESDMHRFHEAMQADLRAAGGRLDAIYFCPFIDDAPDRRYRAADHPDRKPNPGMLLRAIADLGVDPAASLMVGDQASDLEAARRVGMPALLATGAPLDALIAPWLYGRNV
jgi:D-glycero-D-manno-heptose 1,7-bisphosphate phosphatase